MYNSSFVSPSYVDYTDRLVCELPKVFRDIIRFRRGKRKRPINRLLRCFPYVDFISFNVSDVRFIEHFNYYLDKNVSSCYSIYLPLKFSFDSFKSFCVNYNILNIPKLSVSGELLLKGYSRVSTLYLKTAIKYVAFVFNGVSFYHYVVKLKDNIDINIHWEDGASGFVVSFNSYSLPNGFFSKEMGKWFNSSFFPFFSSPDVETLTSVGSKLGKTFYVYNNFLYFSGFLKSFFIVEFGNLFGRLVNIINHKKGFIDADSLSNKYINCLSDIIINLFRCSFTVFNFIKYFRFLLYEYEKHESLSLVLFKENLIINPTIHYINQLNTLVSIHDKFKINVFGYSSASSNSFIVRPAIRKVKSDYVGFINMLYTSDGESCGLLSFFTSGLLVSKKKFKHFSTSKTSFLLDSGFGIDIFSQSLCKVSFLEFCGTLKKNKIFKVFGVEVFTNGEFKFSTQLNRTNLLCLDLTNVLSVTELIIPFLFNNDPCRGLMGSKMHTQALPLLFNQLPYVTTKYNVVSSVVSDRCVCSSADGVVVSVTESVISIQDDTCRYIDYYLCPFNVADYDAYTYYRPTVREGERVQEGQVLAFPKDVENFEYALGFNNFMNYGMYYGYEHEDAIIVNKDLLVKDILTSISFDVYEMFLSINRLSYVELTLPRLKKYNRWFIKPKRNAGFFSKVKHIFEGNILMSKIKYELSVVGTKHKLRKIKKKFFKKNRKLKTTRFYVKIKPGGEGRLIKTVMTSYSRYRQLESDKTDRNFVYLYLRFFIAKVERLKVGDKLCGRHGNKGVVSKIVDSVDMPYMPSGLCPFTITSPVGALARMNVGQFLEGVCGYLGSKTGNRIKVPINVKQSYCGSSLFLSSESGVLESIDDIVGASKCVLKHFRTGCRLKNYSYCSVAYYFKLMHTSKSKYQYRTVGRYSSITQQPVQGKSYKGGQRFGEMEVWALEAHGTAYNLRELSLAKLNYRFFKTFGSVWSCSETFKILMLELKNIFINVTRSSKMKFSPTTIYKDF